MIERFDPLDSPGYYQVPATLRFDLGSGRTRAWLAQSEKNKREAHSLKHLDINFTLLKPERLVVFPIWGEDPSYKVLTIPENHLIKKFPHNETPYQVRIYGMDYRFRLEGDQIFRSLKVISKIEARTRALIQLLHDGR